MNSISDTLTNNSINNIKPLIKIEANFKKLYPSNPLEIIKELKNLNKIQHIKLLISGIIIILFGIFNNIQILGNPSPTNKCYYDVVLEWTRFLNSYFRTNDAYRIIITIIGSVLLDTVFIISSIYWAIYALDWRFCINTCLFYLARGIMQQILILGFPDLLYFKYPHFPSIVVGYIQGSDFFWSGHCGFPVMALIEFIWLKKYYLAGFCAFVLIFESFLMFNCREHYTIDIIFGIIFAHYISMHGKEWVNYIYEYFSFLKKIKNENREELRKIRKEIYY